MYEFKLFLPFFPPLKLFISFRYFLGYDSCVQQHAKFLGMILLLSTKDSLSRVRLFATPWTVAHQAPPSMGFSRQEYWSGLPFPFPGDLPDPGIEPRSTALQEDALTSEPPGEWDPKTYFLFSKIHLNQILSNQVHSMYLWPWILSICLKKVNC